MLAYRWNLQAYTRNQGAGWWKEGCVASRAANTHVKRESSNLQSGQAGQNGARTVIRYEE